MEPTALNIPPNDLRTQPAWTSFTNVSEKHVYLGGVQVAVGKDPGHRVDSTCIGVWDFFIWKEASIPHPLPSWPHRNVWIPKSLVERLPSSPLEFSGMGLVSVLVPCCGVSMGLPELGDCLGLGCNTLGTKAGSSCGVRRREKEGAASSGSRMEKPVTDQRGWAQVSKSRGRARMLS